MYTLSVSELNEQIKTLIESSFCRVMVEGELSRITYHNSGHIYFTLKDSNSTLKAVMFRGNASKLKFQLQEGMKVILDGAITLYKPRGEYQINCFTIEPSGQGSLALAFEQLKEKLSSKGYFDDSRKKELPKYPKKIALITSATGAALQDMLRVANSRYRNVEFDIYDVLVQGESASHTIVNAINKADSNGYDILVIGRGGGSIEDLWAFNEENVAEAIYNASTPIISAVGHEIDWVISDFVADKRAATPSIAMQISLPDVNELFQNLDSLSSQMTQLLSQKIYNKSQELQHTYKSFEQHSIQKQIIQKQQEIKQIKESFFNSISFIIQKYLNEVNSLDSKLSYAVDSVYNVKAGSLKNLLNMLDVNNPALKSKKGFVQLSQDNKVIDITELAKDDNFSIQNDKIYINAKVLSKDER